MIGQPATPEPVPLVPQHVAELAQRLGVAEPPSLTGERVFVLGFFWGGGELPGWQPVRLDRRPAESPPAALAMWSPAGQDADVVVKVDTFETAGAADAHAQLLRLLGQFMNPAGERTDEVGDVALRFGDTAVLAVRGNVTFLVRNAGRAVVPVLDFAASVDGWLLGTTPTQDLAGELLRVDAAREDRSYRLEVQTVDALNSATWLRLRSSAGSVRREGTRLVFLPDPDGTGELTVEAVAPTGDVSVRRLSLGGR